MRFRQDVVIVEPPAERRMRGYLGIAHAETVLNWRERHDSFPEPVAKVGRAHIWAWPDVEQWARKTGRL